jgi:C4-dicarboxylate-specific signal transduction histidine kinase
LVEKQIKTPILTIDCTLVDDEVTIDISDNAGGVPQNIISKIFNPYFTTKHKTQGTGLGLHMSKRIATETLGGDLFVENTDEGAKFSIVFKIKSKIKK